jgi:3-oxoacyl-[acyl-carrier-protein] synthase-3
MNREPARVGLLGLGAHVPERVMENAEWAEWVDTSDEWIRERTGIERRRILAEDESTVDLALPAARLALEDAGLGVHEIDEIVVATDTPEVYLPDTSAILQHRLGAREVPTYDLGSSGCAGFLQALSVARSRVLDPFAAGGKRVLVVGVEALTRLMSWRDRATCVLFGDAAGAAVVGVLDEGRPDSGGETDDGPAGAAEILTFTSGTDGAKADILGLETGGTRRPFTLEAARAGAQHDVVMKGREVFREAVRRMSAASREVLERAGVAVADLALVVPHQANLRIIHAVAAQLGVGLERVFVNVQDYGNTGSASVPLALWEARQQGRVGRGDLVLLTAFGAGFHWAAALLRF